MQHAGFKCGCINERGIVNTKKLNIISHSWANKDIADVELELTGYVMFRRDRIGSRGEELFYTNKIRKECRLR